MGRLTNEQVTKLLYNSLTELDEKLKRANKSWEDNTKKLEYHSEAMSNKLREIKKTKLDVDTQSLKEMKAEIQAVRSEHSKLIEEVEKSKKAIRSDLSDLNKINIGRVPNYIIILIAFMFTASIAILIIYTK
jgi:DNA repair ATPase RecN